MMVNMSKYIPVRHQGMRQMNDCFPIQVLQHNMMSFLYLNWAVLQDNPALRGQPGALPAGLVQPCPTPRALIHNSISLNATQSLGIRP